MNRPKQWRLSRRQQYAGWGQLLLLAMLFWLRLDAHAHEQLHAEHTESETHCAVTWLAQGKFTFGVTSVVPEIHSTGFYLIVAPLDRGVAPAPYLLPFSCGPPQV